MKNSRRTTKINYSMHRTVVCIFLSFMMLFGFLSVSTYEVRAEDYTYYDYLKTITVGHTSESNSSKEGGSAPYYWYTSDEFIVELNVHKSNANYCDFIGVSPGTAYVTLYSDKLVVNGFDVYTVRIKEVWKVTVVPDGPEVKSIKLNNSKLRLNKGQSKALSYTISPKDAKTSVTWESSNTSVATVDSSGVVKAQNKGTATITATTTNGKTARCTVTVSIKAKGVKLSSSKLTLIRGESKKLSYTVTPKGASRKVTFKSNNIKVATVSKNGKVTAKNKGTATITAKTSNGKKATCKVTVKELAKKIKLNNRTLKMNGGSTKTLKYTLSPSGSVAKVKWFSSNKKVATVDSNGKVSAKDKGTAIITAKISSGKFAKCTVKVAPPKARGITLNQKALTLLKGESYNLTYTLTPSKSEDKVSWYSSNKNVATVDSNGKVSTKDKGTATITAKIPSGKSAKCTVKVTSPKANGITLNKETLTLLKGESYNLTYTLTPSKSEDKVSWYSSNKNVATVDSNGKVTAEGKGTAIIKAKIPSGAYKTCIITVGSSIKMVSLGYGHSAFLDEDSDLYTCGDNSDGGLGNGTKKNSYVPIKIMSNVKSVSLGSYHSAAITENGDLYTWGYNSDGQLGNGTTSDSFVPIRIMSNVKSVGLGSYHSAAITENGDLYTWGYNGDGQLGDGTKNSSYVPIRIMGNVKAVNLGSSHSAAITENGDLYTWGYNSDGQLGNGTTSDSFVPIRIMSNVKAVSLGKHHSAAITENSDLYTWGYNSDGQLGDGTTSKSTVPIKVMSNVKSVGLGSYHSAAITENGDLYTWGYNGSGRLGDGTTSKSTVPIKVMSNVKSVGLGYSHSAAITENGGLYTWGYNGSGRLGDGTTNNSFKPLKIFIG